MPVLPLLDDRCQGCHGFPMFLPWRPCFRKNRTMSLMYQLLLKRSGLTANAAAKLHQVPVRRVRDWMRFNAAVPLAALTALDHICRGIDPAGYIGRPQQETRKA